LKVTLENKQWVKITDLCNNSCLFCLDDIHGQYGNYSAQKIKTLIKKGIKKRAARLVLSGGDPTMHPLLPEFIKYGKAIGYKKIQIITNGRKLAYKEYVNLLKNNGLAEATFSVHGPNANIHDACTRVSGSFVQTIQGIKNALAAGLIVNTDTVISKINYKYLLATIKFLYGLGIREANLMSLVPFGRAWENKEEIFYDFKLVLKEVIRSIKYAEKKEMYFWLSRFPPQYLKGFEKYISPTKKVLEDSATFRHDFSCQGERCIYCALDNVCKIMSKVIQHKIKINKRYYLINSENLSQIKGIKDNSIIKLNVENIEKICKVDILIDQSKKYKKIFIYDNVPPCCLSDLKDYATTYCLAKNKIKDLLKEAIINKLVKLEPCSRCIYNQNCRGIPQNYLVRYGAQEFKPVISYQW
ncbi:MAG: radical SAM protein, partial [Candidatus Margulisbacteria bacterium]|nr:radical SAM protein [Candidatus Margulisiibacteriota bacterium]